MATVKFIQDFPIIDNAFNIPKSTPYTINLLTPEPDGSIFIIVNNKNDTFQICNCNNITYITALKDLNTLNFLFTQL